MPGMLLPMVARMVSPTKALMSSLSAVPTRLLVPAGVTMVQPLAASAVLLVVAPSSAPPMATTVTVGRLFSPSVTVMLSSPAFFMLPLKTSVTAA